MIDDINNNNSNKVKYKIIDIQGKNSFFLNITPSSKNKSIVHKIIECLP